MKATERTAENAPDGPLLVWVRNGVIDERSNTRIGGWRPGYVSRYGGLPPRLRAEGFNGDWDIPYWAPLPDQPE